MEDKDMNENNNKLCWETIEDGTLMATISFGEDGYASFFIEQRRDEICVETQCFKNTQTKEIGFDGRVLYFEDMEHAKWYINLMADTINLITADIEPE